ncbi:MAG: ATP-binding protein [Anaerolineae bacterium]|nr:ATP-binding protein [Anaerolineae bacterium]
MPTSSNINYDPDRILPLDGDPNCPICHGIGFVRQDLPIGHPNFGKLAICVCRQQEVTQSSRKVLFSVSNLTAFKDMTFENFNPRGHVGLTGEQTTSLTYAFNQARRFSQELTGWLLFTGGYGCGKTHLAAAIANTAVVSGTPTLFLTAPDLLDWMRFSYDSPDATFEERFEEIRNVNLLVLDDLGTQNATPWAQEKLFQIINHRYVNRLPTVLTSNQDISEIEGRISSRLQDPTLVGVIKISAPDYRSPTVDSTHPLLSSLHLLSHLTFGNFSLREPETLDMDARSSLEKAFRAARDFAEAPMGWLVLTGTYGCGKTHLAAAIGNARLGAGESPMFVVVPDLLDHLRATFSPNSNMSYDRLFDQVRMTSLLILDDLGMQSATAWAREKLYQIFNYRYNANLPTVITTASKIDEIDARIRSRMLDGRLCKIYAITTPPYLTGADGKPRKIAGRGKG